MDPQYYRKLSTYIRIHFIPRDSNVFRKAVTHIEFKIVMEMEYVAAREMGIIEVIYMKMMYKN